MRTLANGVKRWYAPKAKTTSGKWESRPLARPDGSFIDGADNEEEATRVWHEAMSAADAADAGDDNAICLVLELYLRDLAERKATAKTLAAYTGIFQWLSDRWPGLTISELSAGHIKTWLAEHPTWGPSYRSYVSSAIRAALNWAAGAESGNLIPRNPLAGMKLPPMRSRGGETLIGEEDHRRLLAAVPNDLRQVLVALWHTGTRPSNIWHATLLNLDRDQQVLVYAEWNTPPGSPIHKSAHKTGRPLVVPLPPTVFEMCCRLAEQYPDGPLFRTARGDAWNASKLANRLLWYKKKLGIKNVICYGYRHTVATDLLEQGVPDADVAAILGHKGTAMIYKHYGHVGARINRLRETLSRHRPAMEDPPQKPASENENQ